MQRTISHIMLAVVIATMSMSCSSENDSYLGSLKLTAEPLSASDSINIDRYDLFQVREVVKLDGDWLVMSSVSADYNLLFLNVTDSKHYFALRKGRGPGEVAQGSSLHKNAEAAVFYDWSSATCIKLRPDAFAKSGLYSIDTVAVFDSDFGKPTNLVSTGDGYFICGTLWDENTWYCSYNSRGEMLSSVPALEFEEMSKERDRKMSFLLNSRYAVSPDGTKVCVANKVSPSLSFSRLGNGILTEYARKAIPPVGMTAGHINQDFVGGFYGLAADNNNVYVLYSGHGVNGVLPPNECNHLIVYDWNGKPVKRYLLNRNVSSISVDGNSIWAASTHPESCVYRFVLPNMS